MASENAISRCKSHSTITLPQKESGKRSLAKSDEKSDRCIRKSDRKVTESIPKTKKSDRTPFAKMVMGVVPGLVTKGGHLKEGHLKMGFRSEVRT